MFLKLGRKKYLVMKAADSSTLCRVHKRRTWPLLFRNLDLEDFSSSFGESINVTFSKMAALVSISLSVYVRCPFYISFDILDFLHNI